MSTTDGYFLSGLVILVAGVLIWGSFWGGYQAARRLVEHPLAIVALSLLFGVVIGAIVTAGLVGGCMAILGRANF